MAELHLFGIAVDEVRDMFGADPTLAGALRSIAAERFSALMSEQRPRGTMLGKVGPLFRHPIDQPQVPVGPSAADIENLVAGRAIDPTRLDACWQIVCSWLHARSALHADAPATASQIEAIEFDLARAGLPSQFAIGRLWARDLGVNLQPGHGMQVGYAKNGHAMATRTAMHAVRDELDPASRPYLDFIVGFLDRVAHWDAAHREAAHPPLDVVGIWWR